MGDITIKEIIKKKQKAQDQILDILKDIENTTGCDISQVELDFCRTHERTKSLWKVVVELEVPGI